MNYAFTLSAETPRPATKTEIVRVEASESPSVVVGPAELVAQARELRGLRQGWDGVAAPAPTTTAVVLALRSAVTSHEIIGDVCAIRMAPDVDGGVVVYVSSMDKLPGGASARYVSVAHANDGSTSALYFDRASEECVAHDVDGPTVPMSLLRSLVDQLA